MFAWTEYLVLADRLAREVTDEAAQRTAISRAYYAAYGMARNRLIRQGLRLPPRDQHAFIWHTYQQAHSPACRRIGTIGFRLRTSRNDADYRDDFPGSITARARQALGQASELLRLLSDLNPTERCY